VGAQFIRFDAPRLWINSGGLGSMGFGLPGAVGAQMANPEATVFAIAGDGGFQMSVPELATLVKLWSAGEGDRDEQRIPGMVRQWQELFYNNRLCAVELSAFPNVELLAAAYGMKGRIVRTPAELRSALQEAMDEPGPYLMDVRVSQYENVYPMVPAGAAINEMVLAPPQPVPVGKQ